MEIFNHHVYEYKKGLRRMVLYTTQNHEIDMIERRLNSCDISYFITYPGEKNINVFFGDPDCIEVVKSFHPKKLTHFTLEEDFILGAMLGYDIKLQCKRYLKRLDEQEKVTA